MKRWFALPALLICFSVSCRKDESPIISPTSYPTLSVAEAKSWLESQAKTKKALSTQANPELDWDRAKSAPDSAGNYLYLPVMGSVKFQNLDQGYRRMIFRRGKDGAIRSYMMEVVPDGLWLQRDAKGLVKDFTGRVFIYDEKYHLAGGWVFIKGKRAGSIKAMNEATNSKKIAVANPGDITVSCEWVNKNYINSEGEVVIYEEKICSTTPVDLSQDAASQLPPLSQDPPEFTGGGGGGGTGAPAVSNLPGENNAKINPKSYMECFSNLPDVGSKMTVTVYVQEPAPGLPFNIGPNSVGHTAIGLTKTYNGQSITQVVGFYPDATGKDKMHAPSKISDNSGLSYNVSISFTIIASEFNKITEFVGSPPPTYDLLNYNCTNFAFDACKAGGITLPNPVGNMGLMQEGMTPAALGNSIRSVDDVSSSNTKGGSVDKTKGSCAN